MTAPPQDCYNFVTAGRGYDKATQVVTLPKVNPLCQ
jgi:hypothetical protein